MINILFVVAAAKDAAELKRQLDGEFTDWGLTFAEGGSQAINAMAAGSYDVLVVDNSTPGMQANKLLGGIAQEFPKVIRIVLSDQSNHQAVQTLFGLAHQFLSKPCEAKMLREAVERASVLRRFLTDDKLRGIISGVQALPTVPAIFGEVLRELRNEDPSIIRLGQLIAQDPGMCAKLLQLVNSPFFGLSEHVANPAEAILYLGINTVRRLVLSIGILSGFESKASVIAFDRLWRHSWAVGALARNLVQLEDGEPSAADQAFISGLLHDVGKLVLATGLSARYSEVFKHHIAARKPLWEAELEILGTTHGEVGAYLLGLWGLPTSLVEAVAAHHRPTTALSEGFSVTTALHVANCFEHEQGKGDPATVFGAVDTEYLRQLGLSDRLEEWRRRTCGEGSAAPA